jgi:glycosyltransferase involved in cell wall biosynthesis
MHVYLDISPVAFDTTARTGLGRSCICLAKALCRRQAIHVTAGGFGSIEAFNDVSRYLATEGQFLNGNINQSTLNSIQLRIARAGGGFGRNFGRILNVLRNPFPGLAPSEFDLMHSVYARFPRRARLIRCPKVITVHDLTPLKFPSKLFVSGQVGITKRIIESIRKEDFVVFPSTATKNDFLNYTNHSESRCRVIPWGVDPNLFHPHTNLDSKKNVNIPFKRYFLSLSSLAPHKNIKFLVDCFRIAREREEATDVGLVLAGNSSKETRNHIYASLPESQHSMVHFCGFIADEDLATLYSGCVAFLFPSIYEGFGLPVLEAMACGCNIISSSGGSLPEVVSDAGRCIAPSDRDGWIESISEYIVKSTPGQNISAIARSKLFDWDKVADSHLATYRTMINQ